MKKKKCRYASYRRIMKATDESTLKSFATSGGKGIGTDSNNRWTILRQEARKRGLI